MVDRVELDALEQEFAEADIYLPGVVSGFSVFGATGLSLLRGLQAAANRRLEAVGYAEVLIPSCAPRSLIQMIVSNARKSGLLIDTCLSASGEPVVLRPFSESLYLVLQPGATALGLGQRVFQWSTCHYRETQPNLYLNFRELVKCEIMSLHSSKGAAEEAYHEVNRELTELARDDLCLDVQVGERPRRSIFPGSLRSYVAECPLEDGRWQTLFVSHVMDPELVRRVVPSARLGTVLCSAGFSQKMLATVLLHHRQERVWRCPPGLASGVVLADSRATALRDRNALWTSSAAGIGAARPLVFSGQLPATTHIEAAWTLRSTGDPEGPWEFCAFDQEATACFATLPKIVLAARGAEARYTRILQSASSERTSIPESRLEDLAEGLKSQTVAIRLCNKASCADQAFDAVPAIPKLIGSATGAGPCGVCGQAGQRRAVLEAQELYSSFYVPARAGEQ